MGDQYYQCCPLMSGDTAQRQSSDSMKTLWLQKDQEIDQEQESVDFQITNIRYFQAADMKEQ